MYYLVVNPGYNGGVSLWKEGTCLAYREFYPRENYYPARDDWWEDIKKQYPDVEDDLTVFLIHRDPRNIASIEVGGAWKEWAWERGIEFRTIKSSAIAYALFTEGQDIIDLAKETFKIDDIGRGSAWALLGGLYVCEKILNFEFKGFIK